MIIIYMEDMYVFIATKETSSELAKAKYKNQNLPMIQYMFHGDKDAPLQCMISGNHGWTKIDMFIDESEPHFGMEFNHIRQKINNINTTAGVSLDKHPKYAPSALFRKQMRVHDIVEFMTTMPVTPDNHTCITRLSYKNDITLSSFPEKYWPWHLLSKTNFDAFCAAYNLEFLNYKKFINHLNDIDAPPIRNRVIGYNNNTQYLFV